MPVKMTLLAAPETSNSDAIGGNTSLVSHSRRRPARGTCGPRDSVKGLYGLPRLSPALAIPAHVTLHTPLRILQLRPAIRTRPR
jgi:hypothetical protein